MPLDLSYVVHKVPPFASFTDYQPNFQLQPLKLGVLSWRRPPSLLVCILVSLVTCLIYTLHKFTVIEPSKEDPTAASMFVKTLQSYLTNLYLCRNQVAHGI